MKPASFDYLAPRSAEEAVDLLARHGGDARLLAGGQSLIPLINLRLARPTALIDLGCCPELDYIRRDGESLVVGPMTRQATVEHSPVVRAHCPLISQSMPFVGHPVIRNRGTIGGTLAHADRVAELTGVTVALGAVFIAQGPQGRRTIVAENFFVGDLTPDLRPDEMLREIRFPVRGANSRSAFVEASNRHHDLATVGIAIHLDAVANGRCGGASIAANGVAPVPVRLRSTERRLTDGLLDEAAIIEAAALCLSDVDPHQDLHARAEYREMVLPRLVEHGIRQALHGLPEV